MALIYIVEDDEHIQEIEEVSLKSAGHEAKCFVNSESFFNSVDENVPDLVILDIMLPGEDGNEIIQKLRHRNDTKNIPVIMVTARTSDIDLVRSIDNGADDYLKKPFSIIELISRVKALLRRASVETNTAVITLEDISINQERRSCCVSGVEIILTYKEFELLKYLMINKENVLSRDQIMNTVWGINYIGETRTVDMHIKTLRQKLGTAGEHIKTIRNVGYVIE